MQNLNPHRTHTHTQFYLHLYVVKRMMNEMSVQRVRSEFVNDYLSGSRGYTRLCPLCRPEIPICGGRPVLHTDYCLNYVEEEFDGVPQVWFPKTALRKEDFVVAPQCTYMDEGVCIEYFEYYWFLDTTYQPFTKAITTNSRFQGINDNGYYSSDEENDDDDDCHCGVLY